LAGFALKSRCHGMRRGRASIYDKLGVPGRSEAVEIIEQASD
jgi:hypothetical protein